MAKILYIDSVSVKPEYEKNRVVLIFSDSAEGIIDNLDMPPSKANELAKALKKCAKRVLNNRKDNNADNKL